MKTPLRLIFLIVFGILLQAFSFERIDYRDGIRKNVCKEFRNDVLVYYAFVDSEETAPRTEFDVQSTLDSMEVALKWLNDKARECNIELNIKSDYYFGSEFTTTRKILENGTVYTTATTPKLIKGLEELNSWSDGIASRIDKDIQNTKKDGIPEVKNHGNKEKLAAHLIDEHTVESIVLLFMANNFFKKDISTPVNHMNSNDLKFATVSYKYPAIIAQNILSFFGASDLGESINRRNTKKIKLTYDFFPKDIMQDVYGLDINTLDIGDYTKHLIGWQNNLDSKYNIIVTDNIANF